MKSGRKVTDNFLYGQIFSWEKNYLTFAGFEQVVFRLKK